MTEKSTHISEETSVTVIFSVWTSPIACSVKCSNVMTSETHLDKGETSLGKRNGASWRGRIPDMEESDRRKYPYFCYAAWLERYKNFSKDQ